MVMPMSGVLLAVVLLINNVSWLADFGIPVAIFLKETYMAILGMFYYQGVYSL